MSSTLTLLNFPGELLDAILDVMPISDLATMARTSRQVRQCVEPHLYRTVSIRMESSFDTASLVELLQTKPNIASFIENLFIDEIHPRQTRRLLSITMPSLKDFGIDHKGWAAPSDKREIRFMNRTIRPQPNLQKLKLSISRPETLPERYYLTEDEMPLLNHSSLRWLELGNMNISNLLDKPGVQFQFPHLCTLQLTSLNYTHNVLQQLVQSSPLLTSISISHPNQLPPLPISAYHSILAPLAPTLKLLILRWEDSVRNDASLSFGEFSLDLTSFSNLESLAIPPKVLLGPTYDSTDDLASLLSSKLPTKLKVFILEGISGAPTQTQEGPSARQQTIPNEIIRLLRVLMQGKDEIGVPELGRIGVDRIDWGDVVLPEALYEIGRSSGVQVVTV